MQLFVPVIQILCYALFILIFIRIAFSWIGPNPQNAVYRLSYRLTEPFLAPIRNLLPQTMGMDFSPMIASFILLLILQFVGRAAG